MCLLGLAEVEEGVGWGWAVKEPEWACLNLDAAFGVSECEGFNGLSPYLRGTD